MNEKVEVKKTVETEPVAAPAPSLMRRVSWGAIFAGFFVTLVIQIMLTLLGTAIGLTSIDPLRESQPGQGLAIGAGIWLLASGLVSIWIGACVAGRLAGGPLRSDGLVHGIVTWSLSTCATLLLLATAVGALIGGTGALLSGTLAVADKTFGHENEAASVQDQVKSLFPQAGALLPPTGRTEPNAQTPGTLTQLAQQDAEVAAALARMEKNAGANQTQDRDQLVNLLTTKHSMSQQQATDLVNQWDQNFQQTKNQTEQKAREVGDKAARGASRAALWGFIALLLGLLAAAWGGWTGAASIPEYLEVTPTRPIRT
jgi:hypothetical protein